jgi:hypothetical protein
VALAETTEWPNVLADALLDRARLEFALGDPEDLRRAGDDAQHAKVVYDGKGNTAGAAKAVALAATPHPRQQSATGRGGAG